MKDMLVLDNKLLENDIELNVRISFKELEGKMFIESVSVDNGAYDCYTFLDNFFDLNKLTIKDIVKCFGGEYEKEVK